jgi:hypothetical protein
MAARSRRKFFTPENIDGGATPAQTRDVGGGGRELANRNPQRAVADPAPAKPVEERAALGAPAALQAGALCRPRDLRQK